MDDEKCLVVFDIDSLHELDRISLLELEVIYLIRKDKNLLQRLAFRDKQGEKY